jgi:hypothetical protein
MLVVLLGCGLGALATPARPAAKDSPLGEIQLTQKALYPVVRHSASPGGGIEVRVNPPALLWPVTAGKGVRYAVRLSQDAAFPKERTLGATGQPWAVFNPHSKLADGTWYWQYAVTDEGQTTWSPVYTFRVTAAAPVFETRTAKELVAACPRSHPRLLVQADQLAALRRRVQGVEAAANVVAAARKRLGVEPPSDKEVAPKRKGKNQRQERKLGSDASKELGQRVWDAVSVLCQAYLISGEEPFGREAVRWAVHVARWDREGVSGQNNLGDTCCLEAMTLAYDSCYDLLTEADKRQLLKGIQARAGHFFSLWINKLEGLLHREHYWGHILQRAIQAAVVTLGDLPEAEQWLTYAYEVWLARAPTAGTLDGGWMVGTNYNGIEGDSLIVIPALFQSLTGDNLFGRPFYGNNLYYLLYCQPPQSYGDGFGDGHEMQKGLRPFHVRYLRALARYTGDPYAAWYLQKSDAYSARPQESTKKGLDWAALGTDRESKLPEWRGPFALPQARAFRQAGVVAMHTRLEEPAKDLFVGFRSSPWGSQGHANADQNTFNIIAGGERLFYSSGYKMPVGDPHMMGWYKHTRGHNGILVDGKGQPFGTAAYGWIPRFLHGEHLTYCVGDASHAYDAKPTPDEETLPSRKVTEKSPDGQAGLTRFRRHVLLLRPSTVVIYDDLAADHPAEWTWLLHSMEKMRLEADRHRLFASAKGARGRADLFGSVPLRLDLTGHFGVPAVNWRGKTNKDGEELAYADNQWHFTGLSSRKTPAMRYLAVIQIRPGGDGREFVDVTPGPDGWMQAGEWQIRAELDVAKKPYLEVRNRDGTAGLVTGRDHLTVGGKSYTAQRAGSTLLVEETAGHWQTQEAVDEVPDVAR